MEAAAKHQRRCIISGATSPRYQLTNAFKNAENGRPSSRQQPLKWIIMMKHPEEKRPSQGVIFPQVIRPLLPSPPSGPLAARHNPRRGTDRLTNKVNKYFPPLLEANQILILEVWSAEKKQTIGRGELIALILSRSLSLS